MSESAQPTSALGVYCRQVGHSKNEKGSLYFGTQLTKSETANLYLLLRHGNSSH